MVTTYLVWNDTTDSLASMVIFPRDAIGRCVRALIVVARTGEPTAFTRFADRDRSRISAVIGMHVIRSRSSYTRGNAWTT
jgi:hypothetical protein